MKVAILAIAVAAAALSHPTQLPTSPLAEVQRTTATLVVRYIRERILSCEQPRAQYFRRKPTCKAERRGSPGSARIELIPMPDARRDIFGADRRERIVIDLKYDNHAVEQIVKLGQGPWLLNWKGTDKSIRLDIESNDKVVVLNTVVGMCKTLTWRCKLDPSVVSNRIESRDAAATPRHD